MDTEELVEHVLTNDIGMVVLKIPKQKGETPDFAASLGDEMFLVEVKEKFPNPELIQARECALSNGDLYELTQAIEPKGVHRKVIGKAKNQLKAYADNESTYRLIWVHCVGLGNSASADLIFSALYGTETIYDWGTEKNLRDGDCYYYKESQFFKYKSDIDAVVITKQNGDCKLCLNNHSPRYETLRSTKFVMRFGEGVKDPPHEDANGTAFHVDGNVNRGDSVAVLEYLKKKYGATRLMAMPMNHMKDMDIHSLN